MGALITDYTLIAVRNNIALYQHDSGKYAVVRIDLDRGQVYSIMPSDQPGDGGCWFARLSDQGIAYVSRLYSRSYARRMWRQLSEAVITHHCSECGAEVDEYCEEHPGAPVDSIMREIEDDDA